MTEGLGNQGESPDNEIVKAENDFLETEKEFGQADKEQLSRIQSVEFYGPLPPPGLLAQYSEAVPDGANRLLSMVESAQAHRLKMEERLVECQVTDIKASRRQAGRGQIFGLVLGLSIISAGVVALYRDHANAGAIIITGTVVGGVSVFVAGRQEPNKDEPQTPATDTEIEPKE